MKCPFEPLDRAIVEYQDPAKADKICKIQKDLDDTMDIMVSGGQRAAAGGGGRRRAVAGGGGRAGGRRWWYRQRARHKQMPLFVSLRETDLVACGPLALVAHPFTIYCPRSHRIVAQNHRQCAGARRQARHASRKVQRP